MLLSVGMVYHGCIAFYSGRSGLTSLMTRDFFKRSLACQISSTLSSSSISLGCMSYRIDLL